MCVYTVCVQFHSVFNYSFSFFSLLFYRYMVHGGIRGIYVTVVYGGSQAIDGIRGMAAGPHHGHSNTGSKPHLGPTPQLVATPDP